MAAAATPGRDPTSSNFLLRYTPATMTFREYDKKFMVLRPDVEEWRTVLIEDKPWLQQTEAGTDRYTPEEIVKLKKADRVARTLYVLGNTGGTDAYTNGETAYEIRMALRARFAPVDGMGLAELQHRYSEVITKQPYACPDIWVNDLEYFSMQMSEAGGTKKSDADTIAHLITSVPRVYDPVITMITAKPITTTGLLAEAQVLLRNYWVRNIKEKYTNTPVISNKKHHEAYAYTSTPETPAVPMSAQKPWRKYKGMCKYCGKQGHRLENCYAKQRDEGKSPQQMNENNNTNGIKCYNCNKIGHIARNCTEPKRMNSQQVPFVGHYAVEEDFFDSFLSAENAATTNDTPHVMTTTNSAYSVHTPPYHPTSPEPSWELLQDELETMDIEPVEAEPEVNFYELETTTNLFDGEKAQGRTLSPVAEELHEVTPPKKKHRTFQESCDHIEFLLGMKPSSNTVEIANPPTTTLTYEKEDSSRGKSLFNDDDEELQSDYDYTSSSNNNELDSIDEQNENDNENENEVDSTNDADSTDDTTNTEREREEILELQDSLPTYQDKQHQLLKHVVYLNERYVERLIAVKDTFNEIPSIINSDDEDNEINQHLAFTGNTGEYANDFTHTTTGYWVEGGKIGRTTTPYVDIFPYVVVQ